MQIGKALRKYFFKLLERRPDDPADHPDPVRGANGHVYGVRFPYSATSGRVLDPPQIIIGRHFLRPEKIQKNIRLNKEMVYN